MHVDDPPTNVDNMLKSAGSYFKALLIGYWKAGFNFVFFSQRGVKKKVGRLLLRTKQSRMIAVASELQGCPPNLTGNQCYVSYYCSDSAGIPE